MYITFLQVALKGFSTKSGTQGCCLQILIINPKVLLLLIECRRESTSRKLLVELTHVEVGGKKQLPISIVEFPFA